MRLWAATLLFVGICLSAPSPATAQASAPNAALEACLSAAGASLAALEGCKGAVSEPCMEAPGGDSTGGMRQCLGAEARAWTAVLDGALANASEDEARASALGQAQDAWRVWRDAECRYQGSIYAGGSLESVVAGSCFADLTADRAIALIYAERTQDR
jgi:uncharacterized protein YecT (DUF1311 family)